MAKASKRKELSLTETIEFTEATMAGDVRDYLLQMARQFHKPWVAMSESEQGDEILRLGDKAEELVKKMAAVMASKGRPSLLGKIEGIAIKSGVQCTVKLSAEDPNIHQLYDSNKKAVLIIVADAAEYLGEKQPAKPEPDQKSLIDEVQAAWNEEDQENAAKKAKPDDEKVTKIGK